MTVAVIKSTPHSCVHYAFHYVNVFNLNVHCISPKDFFVLQLNVF